MSHGDFVFIVGKVVIMLTRFLTARQSGNPNNPTPLLTNATKLRYDLTTHDKY